MNLFKKGFTLAEVLVTLGILGIVSAMTMPTLVSSHQKKIYSTQLHKVYTETLQALTMVMDEKNALSLTEAGLTSTGALNDFIKEHFNVVQTCTDKLAPCFGDSYTLLNGNTYNIDGHISTSHALASGAAVRPLYSRQGEKVFNFLVDVNGAKRPNRLGRDTFYMAVYNNGTIDTFKSGANPPLTEEQRNSAGSEWGPFGYMLNNNWEMNF